MDRIVRMFANLDAAQRARDELLGAGFGEADVQLKTFEDEAGPGISNFTVGNDPDVVGGEAYQRTFAPEPQAGQFLMMVNAADPLQAEQAAAILARHGATSGDPARQAPRGG
jgi:hypothetical protein